MSTGGAVYGAIDKEAVDETYAAVPINAYGISKLTFERYLDLFHRTHGLDYLIYRPGNPYGEGQSPASSQGAIAVFLGRIKDRKKIEIWGDGSIVRDYVYVDDLVSALVKGVSYKPTKNEPRVFNVGSECGRSLREVVASIKSVVDKDVLIEYKPGRKVDVPTIVLNCERAKKYLNWTPEVEFNEGLQRTWNWLLASTEDRK